MDRSTKHTPLLLPLLLLLFPLSGRAAVPEPQWLRVSSEKMLLEKTFKVDEIQSAQLTGVADYCQIQIKINGKPIRTVENFSPQFSCDVTSAIKRGRNRITVETIASDGPSAVALRLSLRTNGKQTIYVVTDKTWQADGKACVETGAIAGEPWGHRSESITITAVDDYTQWKQALGVGSSADPSSFYVRNGFQIELLHSARKTEGSWVGMAFGQRGRLIIAREDRGLLMAELYGRNKQKVKIETINNSLKECRGLLVAHGALYANANGLLGMYRLKDTNGDDQLDEVKLLLKTGGSKGHGRNDLALGPDGKIYAIHGDAVDVPKIATNLRSPLRKNSHRGKRGFVLRTDAEGKQWEVVTTGLRNPYGIDFNRHGEMFTYDADAEYDTGSPWYRPTRVHHLLPGGDYGWRGVTRSWPAYNPDQPDAAPPGLDMGKGSPTSVKFGYKSRFPHKYQQALFVLDWAYGRILAIHMTPRGSGYAMRAEPFLKGRPFNVTDLAFGPDGAMYVITGGRKTQSGLYRIKYVGEPTAEPKPTMQQAARATHAANMRKVRRQLEAFAEKRSENDLQLIWKHLDSPDPALRHAARVAMEHLPVATWRAKALAETRPQAGLTMLLSLAQAQAKEDHGPIIHRLATFPWKKLTISQKLVALRVYDIILSQAKNELKQMCLQRLDPLYPSAHFAVNKKLSELLVQLKAAGIVPRTMALLSATTQQRRTFHFLYVLRNVPYGWTPALHQQYFQQVRQMRGYIGGEGMPTFHAKIEKEALTRLSKEERAMVAPLLAVKAQVIEIPAEAKSRKEIRKWTVDDFASSLPKVSQGRSFDRGRKMFRAASCVACHRVQRTGAAIGPDLTALAARFSRRDILEHTIHPDKVVAEKYRRDVIETANGKTVIGFIMDGIDYRAPELRLITNVLEPDKVTTIVKKDIESHSKATTSMMPQGLLNTLSREEILDLLAFLESGGNRKHPLYRK